LAAIIIHQRLYIGLMVTRGSGPTKPDQDVASESPRKKRAISTLLYFTLHRSQVTMSSFVMDVFPTSAELIKPIEDIDNIDKNKVKLNRKY
jgi:hypothetical protein